MPTQPKVSIAHPGTRDDSATIVDGPIVIPHAPGIITNQGGEQYKLRQVRLDVEHDHMVAQIAARYYLRPSDLYRAILSAVTREDVEAAAREATKGRR